MNDIQFQAAITTALQSKADQAMLVPVKERSERSYTLAAYRAAEARKLRHDAIAAGRARYASLEVAQ
jgi:hypothetical protein